MNLKDKLKSLRAQIKALAVKADISAEEAAQLESLMSEAERVQAQIKALDAIESEEGREAQAAQAEAQQAEEARIEAAVEERVAAKAAEIEQQAAAGRRLPGGNGAPVVAKFANLWKFDDVETGALSVMAGILSAAGKPHENTLKALAVRAVDDEVKDGVTEATVRGMKMAGMPLKANELNQSTLANFGDEWVVTANSATLWDKIRSLAGVVAEIPTVVVPQGVESIKIPLQSASPTFYKVAQASAQATNNLGAVTNTIPSSKLGTDNETLTVGKIGAAVIYTSELEEDSIIPWANELTRDLANEGAEVLESLVIDGDTETAATTNINDIGGTPAGDEYFLVLNGFRKLALVTNTANSRSAGAMTVEDFLETLKLMGLAGKNSADKNSVAFIVDPWTQWKAYELAELKTRDSFVRPTLEDGQVTSIYGRRVITTWNMHRPNQDTTYGLKANTSGKLDLDTASNNTTGSILAVRFDQWRLGMKRMWRFETMRIPRADATEITITSRVGLLNRDSEASAISYGVTV